jgi:diguanylate cyclase
MNTDTKTLRDSVDVAMICTLFATATPTAIMSVLFVVTAALTSLSARGELHMILSGAGVFACAARLIVCIAGKREISRPITVERARALERRFAASYIAFAAVLGMFASHLLSFRDPTTFILITTLVVGYAAGVAAGVGGRPMIAIPSMAVAVIPPAIEILSYGSALAAAASLTMVAFLVGGGQSVLRLERRANHEMRQKIAYSGLARLDPLTTLPNRLALTEWFDAHVSEPRESEALIAVHCLDLNGFKPVNDRYGHPVGDALLKAVASRLSRVLREGDIAARLGGDEFIVVQSSIKYDGEAELLAKRISKVIGEPFSLDEHMVSISTCVGFVTSNDEPEMLLGLISMADEALYNAKRSSRNVVQYLREPQPENALAA